MNNLETLVREYADANIENTSSQILMAVACIFLVMGVITPVFLGGENKTRGILGCIFVFFLLSAGYCLAFLLKSEKSIDLKKEYNISLEEKQSKLELSYNSKYNSHSYVKNKFKVVFTNDKEEHYFVYFDDKAKDKKSILIEEIQQFFKDNVDYSYYESLEKFRLEDLTQKDNKSSKEANIEDLEKKLNESKNNTEQLQKQLDELKKKIDKKSTEE